MLIILLSTYLPQTIGLYVTIILGLGADVYSLILTMVLVGSFLLLIWRLKKKRCSLSLKKRAGTGHLSSTYLQRMWFIRFSVIFRHAMLI